MAVADSCAVLEIEVVGVQILQAGERGGLDPTGQGVGTAGGHFQLGQAEQVLLVAFIGVGRLTRELGNRLLGNGQRGRLSGLRWWRVKLYASQAEAIASGDTEQRKALVRQLQENRFRMAAAAHLLSARDSLAEA